MSRGKHLSLEEARRADQLMQSLVAADFIHPPDPPPYVFPG